VDQASRPAYWLQPSAAEAARTPPFIAALERCSTQIQSARRTTQNSNWTDSHACTPLDYQVVAQFEISPYPQGVILNGLQAVKDLAW